MLHAKSLRGHCCRRSRVTAVRGSMQARSQQGVHSTCPGREASVVMGNRWGGQQGGPKLKEEGRGLSSRDGSAEVASLSGGMIASRMLSCWGNQIWCHRQVGSRQSRGSSPMGSTRDKPVAERQMAGGIWVQLRCLGALQHPPGWNNQAMGAHWRKKCRHVGN